MGWADEYLWVCARSDSANCQYVDKYLIIFYIEGSLVRLSDALNPTTEQLDYETQISVTWIYHLHYRVPDCGLSLETIVQQMTMLCALRVPGFRLSLVPARLFISHEPSQSLLDMDIAALRSCDTRCSKCARSLHQKGFH